VIGSDALFGATKETAVESASCDQQFFKSGIESGWSERVIA